MTVRDIEFVVGANVKASVTLYHVGDLFVLSLSAAIAKVSFGSADAGRTSTLSDTISDDALGSAVLAAMAESRDLLRTAKPNELSTERPTFLSQVVGLQDDLDAFLSTATAVSVSHPRPRPADVSVWPLKNLHTRQAAFDYLTAGSETFTDPVADDLGAAIRRVFTHAE